MPPGIFSPRHPPKVARRRSVQRRRTGRTPPQWRRPGVSGSEHRRASSPQGTPDPGRVALSRSGWWSVQRNKAARRRSAAAGRRKTGPDREGSNRDRGEDAGAVVAVDPVATGPKRRAYSATRKKRVAGGVDRAPHLPCAKHWGMRCGVVDPDEASSAAGGNPSRGHPIIR